MIRPLIGATEPAGMPPRKADVQHCGEPLTPAERPFRDMLNPRLFA